MASSSKQFKWDESDSGDDTLSDLYEVVLAEEDEELGVDEDDNAEVTTVKLLTNESAFEMEQFGSLNDKRWQRQIRINQISKIGRSREFLTKNILAKVMTKTPLHTSADDKWRFFRVDLKDDKGVMNQIRLTFLVPVDDVMIDVYYSMIELDQVYAFKKLQLKKTDVRFNSLPHPCELYFEYDQSTVCHFVGDDTSFSLKFEYSIIHIQEITVTPLRSRCVDIVGKIRNVTKPRSISYFHKKKRRFVTYAVCEMTVVDQSCKEITVSLWREDADRIWKAWELFMLRGGHDETPMVIIRGLKIVVAVGRITIKILRCGTVIIISDLSVTIESTVELYSLNRWFEEEGGNCQPITKLDLVAQDNYQTNRDAIQYYLKHMDDPEVTITSVALTYKISRTTLNLNLNKMGFRKQKLHHINPEATTRVVLKFQEEKEKEFGKSMIDLAAEEGASYDAARHRNQVLGYAKKIDYNPEATKMVVLKYQEEKEKGSDVTIKQIAEEVGASYAAAIQRNKSLGFAPKIAKRQNHEVYEEVVRLYNEAKLNNTGESLKDVAAQVGIPHTAAKKANQRLGVTRTTERNPEMNRLLAETYIERNKTSSCTYKEVFEEFEVEATPQRLDAVKAMVGRIRRKDNET